MPFVPIDHPGDVRADEYRNVPDAALLERRGIFVAEGRLAVRRLLAESALTTRSAMVTGAACASLSDVFASRPELPVYVVSQAVMDGITGFNIHRGCLAVGERPRSTRWQEIATGARTMVVLERVMNADNVGGIARNAAALGADAVLLDPASLDPLYRKSIRTPMGAALLAPFARATPWPGALHALREQNVALGHEGEGLNAAAIEACDYQALIPIAPGLDSLNVASAAAIALYELSRTSR